MTNLRHHGFVLGCILLASQALRAQSAEQQIVGDAATAWTS